jgi:magnesium chelatase family protein
MGLARKDLAREDLAREDLGDQAKMVQGVATVAFEGIEVRPVDVQVQVAPGMPAFAIACRIRRFRRRANGCVRR